MMTSVTLSSTSGALHGGFSSSVTQGESASGSEPEFESATTVTTATGVTTTTTTTALTTSAEAAVPATATATATSTPQSSAPRSVKRCLAAAAAAAAMPSADSCKKRRKQSTPIRISAAEIDEPTTIPPLLSNEGKSSSSAAVSPEPDLRCPVCQLYFDTSDQLQSHLVSDHPPIECKKEIVEELSPSTTPTPVAGLERSETPLELTMPRNDVQWISADLQSKEWKNPSLANMAFNPTNPMFMTLPQFVQSDSIPRQPIRIFNPDAYCDLCNKEFCNKYFLKTHKANKHGIYTDMPTANDQPLSVASNCVNIPSFTSGGIKPPPPPPPPLANQQPPSSVTTSVPSVEIPFIKNEQTKITTNMLNPFSDMYPNPFSNKLTKSNMIPSKQIASVTVGGSGSGNVASATSTTTSCTLFDSNDSADEHNQHSNGFQLNSINNAACANDTSDIMNKKHQLLTINNTDDQPLTMPSSRHDESSSSPTTITTITTNPTESTSYKTDLDGLYYEQSKLSPGQQQQLSISRAADLELSNRLRKIGVMNPKAFCEICCKEYCNKYFLRTHKMKRHGIYIPEDKDMKEMKMDGCFGNFNWQIGGMQTSPLNLIMTEQSSSDRKTTSPNDISCEICGIKFQNASLAQLHNISVHGKLHAKQEQDAGSFDGGYQDDSVKKALLQDGSGGGAGNISEVVKASAALNAEAISEDLQKLQTMILQLNDLDVSKVYRSCNSCNKEFENRYFLHAHMMTEHGILLDEAADPPAVGGPAPAESENSSNNNTMCELSKEGQNVDEMKNHFDFHSSSQLREEPKDDFGEPDKGTMKMSLGTSTITSTTTTSASSGQLTERRISMNVTPTSSYCDICNKELCNKYFMKTHMQRMHGIEIENGAQIGGVVCDICNKELCSKYFLRVHKHNTHGIVEYGSSLLQPRKSDGEPPPAPQPPTPVVVHPEQDSALKPADLADLSHRYFSHFTEVCTICSRRFRSTKWLKAHLLSDHGQAGAEKWAELEQQLQQTIGSQIKQLDCGEIKSEPTTSPTTTIKIPNGSGSNGGSNANNGPAGIQNVLSSLFGVDETNAKTYQCSYCSFTTSLLPLLFVHERSHTMSSSNNGEMSPQLKCPACPQSFLQPELLQHHLFTQHPFLPLPPFFNGNNNSQAELSKESESTTAASNSATASASASVASTATAVVLESAEDNFDKDENSSSEQSALKTINNQKLLNQKQKAKIKMKRLDLVPTEIGQSLKDVAKRAQIPATYALPQPQSGDNTPVTGAGAGQGQQQQSLAGQQQDLSSGQNPDEGGNNGHNSGYVMQAFLLEENAPERRRVVPAVVFLPVVQKQPAPLTVTFTLTPA